MDVWLDRLRREERLTAFEVMLLCRKVIDILVTEPNVVEVSSPVTICGDTHGQWRDLTQIFQYGGHLPDTNYLFMGDYVDRGPKSVEVISFLFALKVKYPERIVLLRGNHECRSVTRNYGFYDECQMKYDDKMVWRYFMEAFDHLPLSALVDGKIFCMHGGLSPDITYLDEVRVLDRLKEVPMMGPMTDLLWSDPELKFGWSESSRGAGYCFGENVTTEFNRTNQLDFIARAHQVADNGYLWQHQDSIVTIFSSANYCDKQGNLGSIMELDDRREANFLCYSALNYINPFLPEYLDPKLISCDQI